MSNAIDMLALRSIYAPVRENPHEKKAKLISAVMPDSGYAKPLLAGLAGRELSDAEEWDTNREAEMKDAQASAMSIYKDQAAAKDKVDKMKAWIQLVGKDADIANAFNEKFEIMPGVVAKSKLDAQGWVDVDIPKNDLGLPEGYQKVHLGGIAQALNEPDPQKRKAILDKSSFPINKKGKNLQRVQKGGRAVYLDENNEEVEGLGGPYFKPKEAGGGGDEPAVKIGRQKQISKAVTDAFVNAGLDPDKPESYETHNVALGYADKIARHNPTMGPNEVARAAIQQTNDQFKADPRYNFRTVTPAAKPGKTTPAPKAAGADNAGANTELTNKVLEELRRRGTIR